MYWKWDHGKRRKMLEDKLDDSPYEDSADGVIPKQTVRQLNGFEVFKRG